MAEKKLPPGIWIVGRKMYGVCDKCGSVVCINKALFGSLHLRASHTEERG